MAAHLSVVGLGLVMLLTGCSVQGPLTGSQNTFMVGKQAPDWSGTDLDGKKIALSDYKGHPLLINFWASWCGPCRAEQPALNSITARYAPVGFRIVGVDIRDSVEQAKIFRNEFKMPYRSVFDQAARLGFAYQVDAPPSSVFIDAHGVVAFKITGELSEESFRQIIEDKLLGKHLPSPAATISP